MGKVVAVVRAGLAHVQRGVLEQRGSDELRMPLGDPPGDAPAERVADEHRRAAGDLPQDLDEVRPVVLDDVGPRRVAGRPVAAQVDLDDPPPLRDLRR
jgi:hypothetical protein